MRLHVLFSLLVLSVGAFCQSESAADDYLDLHTYPLYSGPAPGAQGTAPEDVPLLVRFDPWNAKPNRPAVIVVPGGAYSMLASNHEGRQLADWFTQRGITAFVLRYRLGAKYLYPTPLNDAKRAVRLVRSHAQEIGLDPNRIGMLGFSAGGHLTAMVSVTPTEGQADSADPVERVSDRLNFVVLAYPWLNAMYPSQDPWISYCSVLKIDSAKCQTFEKYSPVRGVSAKTPTTFLFHTENDETVPVTAVSTYYDALHRAGVSVELHIFSRGPHGVGLGGDNATLETWGILLENWLRTQKLLP